MIPEPDENGVRWYGGSAMRKPRPEDKSRCVAEVSDVSGWHFQQCSRARGRGVSGLFCKQHAVIYESHLAERLKQK